MEPAHGLPMPITLRTAAQPKLNPAACDQTFEDVLMAAQVCAAHPSRFRLGGQLLRSTRSPRILCSRLPLSPHPAAVGVDCFLGLGLFFPMPPPAFRLRRTCPQQFCKSWQL